MNEDSLRDRYDRVGDGLQDEDQREYDAEEERAIEEEDL